MLLSEGGLEKRRSVACDTAIITENTEINKDNLSVLPDFFEKVPGVAPQDTLGLGSGESPVQEELVQTGKLYRAVQPVGEVGAVGVGAQGQTVLRSQLQEVLRMAPQVVRSGGLSVLPEEGVVVVQPDEAAPAHHLGDLIVGEVALMPAHRPGVGVAGHEGLLGSLEKIVEALVV